jgi:hypothetical protein
MRRGPSPVQKRACWSCRLVVLAALAMHFSRISIITPPFLPPSPPHRLQYVPESFEGICSILKSLMLGLAQAAWSNRALVWGCVAEEEGPRLGVRS